MTGKKRRKKAGYDARGEMTGQLSLFTLDAAELETQIEHADEGTCLANEDCWCRVEHPCEGDC